MINLPIYRAKKIGSDEYANGYLIIADDYDAEVDKDQRIYFIMHKMENYRTNEVWDFVCNSRIDPTTLAIHFPDTNIKDLFFGIDNMTGASIIEAKFISDNTPFKGVAMHTHYGYVFYDKNSDWVHITKLKDIKVIGIQE